MRSIRSLALAAVAAAGCTSTSSSSSTLDGTWSGKAASDQNFTLHLATQGDAITGSSVIDPGNATGQPFAGTVIGALSDGGQHVAFTITTSGGSVAYDGSFADADDLLGYLDGSGWSHSELVLSR